MAVIKRVRSVKGGGILADRSAKDPSPTFARYNLLYGFNGSGKSTVSRLFGCLQSGVHSEELPEGCNFEIELEDSTVYKGPSALQGLEDRVCVFNTDFIERNLRWSEGRATSIFYISEDQADLAAELHASKAQLPAWCEAKAAADKLIAAREKALKTFRTERARTVSGALHLGNRRYEAGQLQADFDNLPYEAKDALEDSALEALVDVARLSAPPPSLSEVEIETDDIQALIENARTFADLGLGELVLQEFETHPSMVPWIKTGHDYHTATELESCLLCGNTITPERKTRLATALDDKIGQLMTDLRTANRDTASMISAFQMLPNRWPKMSDLDLDLQADYQLTLTTLRSTFEILGGHLGEAARVVLARLATPTSVVAHKLPQMSAVVVAAAALSAAMIQVNAIIIKHNAATSDFGKRQEAARNAIKKHFLSGGHEDYAGLVLQCAAAQEEAGVLGVDIDALRAKIADLSAKVNSHGPAAEHITKLVGAYLGHGELTIVAAEEGYELHRHNKIVKGPPSEGEKTAIALCYFLSTLECNGRKLKNLIVVVDDPISSLDTRAMNYACALVRTRLKDAAQVFVLTHNQHCMNEFKKAWRSASDAEPPTAMLLYMDVKVPEATGRRTAEIILMPGHLRGYDSEYHFLCHKVLQFEAAGEGHSEYWFMMANVVRRVLELFLAFKTPGSHGLEQKLEALAKRYPEVDPIRIAALSRLIQVESHTDTLEDLIAHSSMTIEETRDANKVLLELMTAADDQHVKAIRKQCKAA